MTQRPIRIIYVASLGHSGSTLLDVLLGQHSAIQSLGEMMFLEHWLDHNNLCSCGEVIHDCPFWQTAGVTDQQGDRSVADRTFQLLQNLQSERGQSVFVDSSKSLDRLKLLDADDRFEVTVVHLLRNGLAVVNSLRQSHSKPGTAEEEMTQSTSLLKAILRWRRRNLAIDHYLHTRQSEAQLRVRYEDLCAEPEQEISRVLDLMGLAYESEMSEPQITDLHNIAGSRWRFKKGPVKIKLSEAWKSETKQGTGLIFRMLAGRLNKSYGYSNEIS